MAQKFSLRQYKQDVANFLRAKEADMRRGNLQSLEQLDSISDAYLLKKWTWISAVWGAAASFLAAPFFLTFISPALPLLLREFCWAVVKVCMGMSLLMFCAAIYFTIIRSAD